MPRPDRKRTRLTGHAVAILLSVALAVLGWAPRAEAQIAPPLSARSPALHRARPSLPPAVRTVLRAARSQLGTPYVYGGSAPGGFDCSGFTMWAWAHAGVELPHNAAAQYDLVREHVDRGSLRPGDLLFFYSPIGHVAIYLGHGMMIEAPHTGDVVHVVAVYWQDLTGAARPSPPPTPTRSSPAASSSRRTPLGSRREPPQ